MLPEFQASAQFNFTPGFFKFKAVGLYDLWHGIILASEKSVYKMIGGVQ
jgi:hypothetical protein